MSLISKVKKNHIFLIFVILRKITDVVRVIVYLRFNPGLGSNVYLGRAPKVYGVSKIKLPEIFSIGDNAWLEAVSQYRGVEYNPHVEIGNNFSASNSFHLACSNNVRIGHDVLVGSHVHITDHAHGIYSGVNHSAPHIAPAERLLTKDGFVIIGDNVWIGDGVVVLPNTIIGSGSIIGANSVVTKNIPENVIAVGTPAKVIKKWDEGSLQWLSI